MLLDGHIDRLEFRYRTNLNLCILASLAGVVAYFAAPAAGIPARNLVIAAAVLGAAAMGAYLMWMHAAKGHVKVIFLMMASSVLLLGSLLMPAVLAWMFLAIGLAAIAVATAAGHDAPKLASREFASEFLAAFPFLGAFLGRLIIFPTNRMTVTTSAEST